eukprot:1195098-Prorocentrum_minimum.AAC.7
MPSPSTTFCKDASHAPLGAHRCRLAGFIAGELASTPHAKSDTSNAVSNRDLKHQGHKRRERHCERALQTTSSRSPLAVIHR